MPRSRASVTADSASRGREMHDVQRRLGQLRQIDGAMRRPRLRGGPGGSRGTWARVWPCASASCISTLDDRAVLGMHADHARLAAGDAHGLEQGAVVHHEHAGIGHEQLEAGHAFVTDQRLHVGQRGCRRRRGMIMCAPTSTQALSRRLCQSRGHQQALRRSSGCRSRRAWWCRRRPRLGARAKRVHGAGGAERAQSRCVCTSTPPGSTSSPAASAPRRRCRREAPADGLDAPVVDQMSAV